MSALDVVEVLEVDNDTGARVVRCTDGSIVAEASVAAPDGTLFTSRLTMVSAAEAHPRRRTQQDEMDDFVASAHGHHNGKVTYVGVRVRELTSWERAEQERQRLAAGGYDAVAEDRKRSEALARAYEARPAPPAPPAVPSSNDPEVQRVMTQEATGAAYTVAERWSRR